MGKMKTPTKILLLVVLVTGLTGAAIAATSTAQSTVTITFSEVAAIAVSGNPSTLTIVSPTTPGNLPADQSDSTSTMA